MSWKLNYNLNQRTEYTEMTKLNYTSRENHYNNLFTTALQLRGKTGQNFGI